MASKKTKAANDDATDMTLLPVNAPKGADLMTVASAMRESLCATVIDSPMMYELAAAELVDMQAKYKELEDKRFSITRPMDAAKKAVMALFSPALDCLDGAIKAHKAGMLAYEQEQKRKAAIQQTLLDKIAADQRVQLAAESARQAEEARTQSELAAKLMTEGDAAGVTAALTAAETAQEMACALDQTTAVVSAATAATNVPTVQGVTTTDVWKARVTDLPALLRFIADNPAYHDWIEVKMTGLNEMAKAQRDALRIPGVEPFEEARIAASRLRMAA
jgi:colicin import membrane protein